MSDKSSSNRKIREPIREKNKDINFEEFKTKAKNKPKNETSNYQSKESSTSKYSKIESVSIDDSKEDSNSTLSLLNIVFILLGILFFVLIIIFLISFPNSNTSQDSATLINQTNESVFLEIFNLSAELNIVIIENLDCEFCQTNTIEEDLKVLVSPFINESNITIQRLGYNTSQSEKIFEEISNSGLDYNYTPLFILSNEIETLEIFTDDEISSLFVTDNELDYYVLSAQVVQVKYLNSQLDISNATINLGNPQGVPITYIYDYNCSRCQVMNGGEEIIENFKKNSRISQNYTAPIPELLRAIESVENRNETSFNINLIPAPTSPESEKSHRAIFCAHEQDLFLPVHEAFIQTNLTDLNISDFNELISLLEGDSEDFRNCYNSQRTNNYINNTQKFLKSNEITSLPVLIVGNYPLLEIVDNSIVSILVESELPNFIERFDYTNTSIINRTGQNLSDINNVSMN